MKFLTNNDFLGQISREDLETLTEEQHQYEPEPTTGEEEEEEPTGEEVPPVPVPTVLEMGEASALAEVASYLRGRFDMEAAYGLTGEARNKQLVMYLVDVALWHMAPRATFRMIAEVRETRYKNALKWLEKAETGKSNPDLPRYSATTTGATPARNTLFRFGSEAARSHSF